jgi:hypothetical protein
MRITGTKNTVALKLLMAYNYRCKDYVIKRIKNEKISTTDVAGHEASAFSSFV